MSHVMTGRSDADGCPRIFTVVTCRASEKGYWCAARLGSSMQVLSIEKVQTVKQRSDSGARRTQAFGHALTRAWSESVISSVPGPASF